MMAKSNKRTRLLLLIVGVIKSSCYPANPSAVNCLNKILQTHGSIYVVTVTRSCGNRTQTGGKFEGHLGLNQQRFNDLKQKIAEYCSSLLGSLPHDSLKLVVLNEYFFQKYEPVDKGDANSYGTRDYFINEFKRLSANCSNTIFYINFLYKKQITNPQRLNAVVQRNRGNYISNSAHAMFKLNNLNKIPQPPDQPQFVVRNVTYGIYHGRKVTKYKKRTYFHEWDEGMLGNCYDFGVGVDQNIIRDINIQEYNIANKLVNSISTEICFDLNKGVRKRNYWENCDLVVPHRLWDDSYPSIHLIQSNWINPVDSTPNNNNIMNLPTKTLIVHADSCDLPPAGSGLFIVDDSHQQFTCFVPRTQLLLTPQASDKIALKVWEIS